MDYSTNTSPSELLELVCDKDSFIRFLIALSKERKMADELLKAEPQKYRYTSVIGWENGSIDTYLDAAAAWLEDNWEIFQSEGRSEISWRLMAGVFYAGKIYE